MGNIISTLNNQLAQILYLIKIDLKNKTTTYNYYFNEDEIRLLDRDQLIDYLTEKKIENKVFLTTINERCTEIIECWNKELSNFPISTYSLEIDGKEFYQYSNPKKRSLSSKFKFNCIVLHPIKWEKFNTETGKDFFFETYNSEMYTIQGIAKKCLLILDAILTGHPETNPEYILKGAKVNISSSGGRPKASRATAKELLTNNIINKEGFLLGLRKEFLNSDPREFVYLLKQLKYLYYIKEEPRVTYYRAFESYFDKEYSRDNNKNNFWKENEDAKLMGKIENRLINVKESTLV